MKNFIYLIIIFAFIFAACSKKEEKISTQKEPTSQQRNEDSLKIQKDREMKVKEALEEEKIVKDTLGQWAIKADASSTYQDHTGNDTWSADQLVGPPDVDAYGDNGKAWTSKEQDKGIEWIKMTYTNPVNATEVRVRQTYNPGTIIKVELIDTKGKSHTVWEGLDKTKYEPDKIKYFIAKFDKTDYKTNVIKLTLATNSLPGWKEIDAVQLIGN